MQGYNQPGNAAMMHQGGMMGWGGGGIIGLLISIVILIDLILIGLLLWKKLNRKEK